MTEASPLQRDIEARLAAAGLPVPPDLLAGLAREAGALLRQTALLRGPRSPPAEPFSATWPVSGQ